MILVDTPIWSLALRRRQGDLSDDERRHVEEWEQLVRNGAAQLIGPVRQELLSGVRDEALWEQLRQALAPFPDLRLSTPDYELASRFFNRCRARGVTGSSIDLLLCAAAHRYELPIYTTDADFARYAGILNLRLHAGPASTE